MAARDGISSLEGWITRSVHQRRNGHNLGAVVGRCRWSCRCRWSAVAVGFDVAVGSDVAVGFVVAVALANY